MLHTLADGLPAQGWLLLISAAGGFSLPRSLFLIHVYLKPDFEVMSSIRKSEFFFLQQI
jgi:hypothetical protein